MNDPLNIGETFDQPNQIYSPSKFNQSILILNSFVSIFNHSIIIIYVVDCQNYSIINQLV